MLGRKLPSFLMNKLLNLHISGLKKKSAITRPVVSFFYCNRCRLLTLVHKMMRSQLLLAFHSNLDSFVLKKMLCVSHLSSEQDGSVIVFRMPLAAGVELLLPHAEVAQGNTAIA